MAACLLAALAYIVIIYLIGRIEKRFESETSMSDAEWLWEMARKRQCSEFDIFRESTGPWNVSESRINDDFKKYLVKGRLPHYVRDFVRRNKQNI